MEAAGILLCVVTTPGIDRRAVNEDAIEASITLLRLHLSKHLIAALNNTGYFLSNSSTNTDSNVVGTKSPSSSSPPALKKRRRSVGALSPAEATSAQGGATSVEAKDLKKAYKLVTATTVTLTLLLMDRLEALIRCLPMNEQQVLLVTSGCLPAVEIHCQLASSSAAAASNSNGCLPSLAHQLQVATNGIWTAAFRHYPTLRGVLLEDLSSIIFKLPTGKRSMRSFPVRYASLSALETWTIQVIPPSLLSNVAQEPHCIQMITSLLLSLVHACVTKPTIDCNNNDEADAGQDQEHQKPAKFTSGLRSCHTIAVSIVSLMLKQCNNGKAGGSIEYRQIFSHMVDDMLLVLTIPEYPAAELLLLTIQRRLNHEITATSPCFGRSSTQKQPQLEVMYLNFAFDILGKIGAVQARLLAVARDKTIQMTNSESLFDVPMSNSSSGDQKVTCYCNTKDPGDMMVVQCDRCHALWHGPCVGIDESNSAPDEWFCDACTLGNIQQRTKSSLPHSESGYIDFQYTMRACVHAMVTNQPSRVDIAHDAAQFCLARWVDEIERKALVNELDQRPNQIVGRLLDSWDYIKQVALPLSDDGRIRVILSLMTQASPFFLAFKKQLQLILSIMSSDNGHSWRKLSLKVVEKVGQ